MCSSNARHQKEDLRQRLRVRFENHDVPASIGKYTCLASAVRARLTLDVDVFSSRRSNEYQRPAFTVISAAPQKQSLQVRGQRSGPGQNHRRLTLTSKGSRDRLLFQPGTLDIIICGAERNIEESKQGDARLGREMEKRNYNL